MNIVEAFDMIERGETPEQYKKRIAKIRRYTNEKYDLLDSISVLDGDIDYVQKLEKKKARLKKVEEKLLELGGDK